MTEVSYRAFGRRNCKCWRRQLQKRLPELMVPTSGNLITKPQCNHQQLRTHSILRSLALSSTSPAVQFRTVYGASKADRILPLSDRLNWVTERKLLPLRLASVSAFMHEWQKPTGWRNRPSHAVQARHEQLYYSASPRSLSRHCPGRKADRFTGLLVAPAQKLCWSGSHGLRAVVMPA